MKKALNLLLCLLLAALWLAPAFASAEQETITLRICNWEEYIDLGGWEEDETIDLDSGDIFGENSLIEDFEAWYEETYEHADYRRCIRPGLPVGVHDHETDGGRQGSAAVRKLL